MHRKGIVNLIAVVLLCLPSLVGAIALLVNFLLNRPIAEWDLASSISVALAVLFGWPLVFVAMIVGGAALLNLGVSTRIKLADGIILGLGALAALIVLFRFRI